MNRGGSTELYGFDVQRNGQIKHLHEGGSWQPL